MKKNLSEICKKKLLLNKYIILFKPYVLELNEPTK